MAAAVRCAVASVDLIACSQVFFTPSVLVSLPPRYVAVVPLSRCFQSSALMPKAVRWLSVLFSVFSVLVLPVSLVSVLSMLTMCPEICSKSRMVVLSGARLSLSFSSVALSSAIARIFTIVRDRGVLFGSSIPLMFGFSSTILRKTSCTMMYRRALTAHPCFTPADVRWFSPTSPLILKAITHCV